MKNKDSDLTLPNFSSNIMKYDKMSHHNYTYINTVCPDCKGTHIIRDNHRQETYCNHCGYIIQDNTLFQITTVLNHETHRNIWLNQFWKKTNSQKGK